MHPRQQLWLKNKMIHLIRIRHCKPPEVSHLLSWKYTSTSKPARLSVCMFDNKIFSSYFYFPHNPQCYHEAVY